LFTCLKFLGAHFRRLSLVSLGVAAASASAFAVAAPSLATDHYYCLQSYVAGGQCGYGSTLSKDYRNRAYVPAGDGSHEVCASYPGDGFLCALNNSDHSYSSRSYYPYVMAPNGGTMQGLTSTE
jgi:uncharacterized low-complexity protein